MSALGDHLRELAAKVRGDSLTPELLAEIARDMLAMADELEDAEREAEAEVDEAKAARRAAESAAAEAESDAEDHVIEAERKLEWAHDDMERILEAVVAAREGAPLAAGWAVDRITRAFPDLAGTVPRHAGFARTRPADYWSH